MFSSSPKSEYFEEHGELFSCSPNALGNMGIVPQSSRERVSLSTKMSPANTVLGEPNFDSSVEIIVCGSHAQVFQGTDHGTKSWSMIGIALIESNERGGTCFTKL